MIKFILTVLFLFTTPSWANTQETKNLESCVVQLPFGLPIVKGNISTICRKAYVTQYDNTAKIPVLVAYTLRPEYTHGCVPRSNRFSEDLSFDTRYRSKVSDYTKTGYDIGHMVNSADMSWDADAQEDSFILSNTAPQLPNLNRGVWKMLETKIRAWANSGKVLSIYIGSVYDDKSEKIGDGVVVPNSFYKIIIDNATQEPLGFLFPNEPGLETDLRKFQVSIAEIELRTGLKFPTSGDKNKLNFIWPANIKKLILDKRVSCGLER